MTTREPGDLLLKAGGTDEITEHDAGIVEAQCLVEVAGDEIVACHRGSHTHPRIRCIDDAMRCTAAIAARCRERDSV